MNSRRTGHRPGYSRYVRVRDHHAVCMVVFCSRRKPIEIITVTLILFGLAMDALAVSLGVGTAGQIASLRGKNRVAAHFRSFQALMATVSRLTDPPSGAPGTAGSSPAWNHRSAPAYR